ncbi:MAG: hypothetical protein NVS3B20_10290 [Polyangiales bacterium]
MIVWQPRLRHWSLFVWALAVGAGCGPSSADAAPETNGAVTWHKVYTDIYAKRCSGMECHGGFKGTTEALAYGRLVGVASNACAGALEVDPGKPENSSLLLKQAPDFAKRCNGRRMPVFGSPLDDAEIEEMRQWILGGAKP